MINLFRVNREIQKELDSAMREILPHLFGFIEGVDYRLETGLSE